MPKSSEQTEGFSPSAVDGKTVKNNKKNKLSKGLAGIMGIGLAFVFLSIASMVALVWMGTDNSDWLIRSSTIPAIGFEATLLGIAFWKIFK
jgi:hypothetical protein